MNFEMQAHSFRVFVEPVAVRGFGAFSQTEAIGALQGYSTVML